MRFYIRKEDIEKGKRGNCRICPIALAIKRKLKDNYRVSVSDTIVITTNMEKVLWSKYATKRMIEFIRKFDNNIGIVKPMSFQFNIPEEYFQ